MNVDNDNNDGNDENKMDVDLSDGHSGIPVTRCCPAPTTSKDTESEAEFYGLHCGKISKLVIICSHIWVACIHQVHASLDDWSQGYKRTKSNFCTDTYESIYWGHELFLNTLCEEHPEFYHKLMSGLYNAVASWDIFLHRLTILSQLERCLLCQPYCDKLHGLTQPSTTR